MKTIEATAAQSWCLVRIDGRPLAVALHAVAEIVEAEELTRLPLCWPRVVGMCTYRRDLLPVIHLLPLPAAADPPASAQAPGRTVVMLLRSEHGTWGLQIDRGGADVVEGPLDDDPPAPAEPGEAVALGTITRGGTTAAVIDPEATWRTVRDAIERWYRRDPR